jgi:hypothetical protein
MTVLRRAGVVLIVVPVLALAAMATGTTKKHKWPSPVKLTQPSSTQFAGTVGSKYKPCRDQRLVTLYYTDAVTGQTQPLSVQRTNKAGEYQVDLTQPAYGGSYQAQVPKVSKQRIQICKAGSSNVVTVVGVAPAP